MVVWPYLMCVAAGCGAAGIWLLMPPAIAPEVAGKYRLVALRQSRTQPFITGVVDPVKRRKRRAGVAMTAVGFSLFTILLPMAGYWGTESLLLVLAGLTMAGAIGTVVSPGPHVAVRWYAAVILGTAGLFLLRNAYLPTLAMVVAYAGFILPGALLVLASLPSTGNPGRDPQSSEPALAAIVGMMVTGVLATVLIYVLPKAGTKVLAGTSAVVSSEKVLVEGRLVQVGVFLFGVSLIGLISRQDLILSFLSTTLALQASALLLVAWARIYGDASGQMWAVLVMAAAVMEAAVMLGLLRRLHLGQGSLQIALWHELHAADDGDAA